MCDGVPLAEIAAAEGTPLYVYSAATITDPLSRHRRGVSVVSALAALRAQGQLDAGDRAAAARARRAAPTRTRAARSTWRCAPGSSPSRSCSPASARPPPSSRRRSISASRRSTPNPRASSSGSIAWRASGRRARGSRCGSTPTSTHAAIRTSRPGSRPTSSASRSMRPARSAGARRGATGLEIVGLHIHVGSQITDLDPLRRAAEAIVALARELRDDGDRRSITWISAAASACRTTDQPCRSAGLCRGAAAGRPGLRPGHRPRARDATSSRPRARCCRGSSTSRTGRTGSVRDPRCRHDRVDCGRCCTARSIGSSPSARSAAVEIICDIVGPLCESSDTLGKDRRLPRPEVGDLLAVLDAGAYGAVMASNYNRRTLPAEVLVENGKLVGHPTPADDRRHAGARDVTGRRMKGASSSPSKASTRAASRRRPKRVRDQVSARGRECRLLSFPDYTTPIGAEICRALHGERDYAADVMQLLYVANRYEQRAEMSGCSQKAWSWSATATLPRASPMAKRRGSIRRGCADIQRFLPPPDLTDPAGYRAGNSGAAEGGGPRSLRARSAAAVARARQLPAPGRRPPDGSASTASDRDRRSPPT